MEETLDEALGAVVPARRRSRRDARRDAARAGGQAGAAATPAPAADVAALSAQAREIYDRAMKAQREGNWALYGEEIKRLGEVLAQLAKR